MTKALINARIEKDALFCDVVTTTHAEKLSEKDLAGKYIGIVDPSAYGKVFIMQNDRKYEVCCVQYWATWPSYKKPTILEILQEFPKSQIFLFETPQQLVKWLAE